MKMQCVFRDVKKEILCNSKWGHGNHVKRYNDHIRCWARYRSSYYGVIPWRRQQLRPKRRNMSTEIQGAPKDSNRPPCWACSHLDSCYKGLKRFFMFEFPCIITLYYIKHQQVATLAVLFISHCNITLHCFGRFLRPSSGVLKTVVPATGACHGSGWYISSKDVQGRLPLHFVIASSHWCMSWVGMIYIQ